MEGVNPMAADPSVITAARSMFAAGYRSSRRANKAPWSAIGAGSIRWTSAGPARGAQLPGDRLPRRRAEPSRCGTGFRRLQRRSLVQDQLEEAASSNAFFFFLTPGKPLLDGTRFRGRHRYVTDIRGTLGNSAGSLALVNIDVRGKGHTVLPPSPHPDGGVYEWMEGRTFEDFPGGIPVCPDFVYDAWTGVVAQNSDIDIQPPISSHRFMPRATAPITLQTLRRLRGPRSSPAGFTPRPSAGASRPIAAAPWRASAAAWPPPARATATSS